jgi:hypothetical protein
VPPRQKNAITIAKQAWAMGAEAVAKHYVPDSAQVLVATKIVNPGESETLFFRAPKEHGVYPYVCTLPGHAMTMMGALYVGVSPSKEKTPTVVQQDFPVSGLERAKELKKSYLRYQDSGRLFSGTLFFPGSALSPVCKGIALRIGEQGEAGVVFDPDMMRMSTGWFGPFIRTTDREDEATENRHKIGAAPIFLTESGPGWDSIYRAIARC